jgi:hypothetical protein
MHIVKINAKVYRGKVKTPNISTDAKSGLGGANYCL